MFYLAEQGLEQLAHVLPKFRDVGVELVQVPAEAQRNHLEVIWVESEEKQVSLAVGRGASVWPEGALPLRFQELPRGTSELLLIPEEDNNPACSCQLSLRASPLTDWLAG